MRRASVLVVLTLAGCGGANAPRGTLAASCSERLTGDIAAPLPAVDYTPPLSRVVVDVRVETGAIVSGLDRAVPRRVAEQRGLDAGAAGKLDVVVDRGPFSIALSGDELAIDVDLQGEARVCKPLGPFGCVGWASCTPSAHARASVALVLDAELRVPPSKVAIPITRPCTLTALGVDVTERVQREADRRARAIGSGIDAGVPIVAPLAQGLWAALAASVPVGASTCARVKPTGLVQAGPRRDGAALAIGLGVEGEVVVETPCVAATPAGPLPAPRLDRTAQPGVALHVPIMTSWDEVGLRVARALAPLEVHSASEVVRITNARAMASGTKARLVLTVAGATCGQIALEGTPSASPAGEVRFSDLSPAPGESSRLARSSPTFDLDALTRAISSSLRLPPLVDVSAIPKRIDRVARELLPRPAPGDPEVSIAMHGARVETVVATPTGLAVVVEATGDSRVSLR